MPGFSAACPPYTDCPLNTWVTMASVALYLLFTEAALLAISFIVARLHRRDVARQLIALLAVIACALIASTCVAALLRMNPRIEFSAFGHYSPARALQERQALANTRAQMNGYMLAMWALFVVGTLFAAMILFRPARQYALRREHSS